MLLAGRDRLRSRSAQGDAMITVIIPYYQEASGILQRALRSVNAQRDCPLPLHVIVVDDSSPVPAENELLDLGDLGVPVQCIRRPNGGPGAARNMGLDNAPEQTRYVAFLDSDDEWSPDHLARAVAALESGYDFYFADHLQLGAEVSAFRRAGRISPENHPALADNTDLHGYQGDMLDQIVRGNVIGTSTVVFDYTRFRRHRFKVEFTNAGEDYLFWIDLVLDGARCTFSARTEAVYGRGVNVYAGSNWGSERHLLRVHNEIKFKKLLRRAYPLNELQRHTVDESLATLRWEFASDVMRRLRHRHSLPLNLLSAHLMLDPLSYVMLPVNAIRIFRQRASGQVA
jgi:succinoglycan biosynthesis protein ExoW